MNEAKIYIGDRDFPSMIKAMMETTLINAKLHDDDVVDFDISWRNDFFIVVHNEQNYAGFLTFRRVLKGEFEIVSLIVDRKYRRRGCATEMLDLAKEHVKNHDGSKIILGSYPSNIGIRKTLESRGFVFEKFIHSVKV